MKVEWKILMQFFKDRKSQQCCGKDSPVPPPRHHHWPLTGIQEHLLILRNVASLLGNGMSFWSTRRHRGQQNNGPVRAESFWCYFCVHWPWQRDSRVPRGTPAMQSCETSRQCLLVLTLRNWRGSYPMKKSLRAFHKMIENSNTSKTQHFFQLWCLSSLSFPIPSLSNGCKKAEKMNPKFTSC